mmetsp:Transcript_6735/g.15546  ORF Transcript_6735/g.15546 Transcript_6735/m.15546 type:complete len:81 (+) Transcript_6735:149-391(+)
MGSRGRWSAVRRSAVILSRKEGQQNSARAKEATRLASGLTDHEEEGEDDEEEAWGVEEIEEEREIDAVASTQSCSKIVQT